MREFERKCDQRERACVPIIDFLSLSTVSRLLPPFLRPPHAPPDGLALRCYANANPPSSVIQRLTDLGLGDAVARLPAGALGSLRGVRTEHALSDECESAYPYILLKRKLYRRGGTELPYSAASRGSA